MRKEQKEMLLNRDGPNPKHVKDAFPIWSQVASDPTENADKGKSLADVAMVDIDGNQPN